MPRSFGAPGVIHRSLERVCHDHLVQLVFVDESFNAAEFWVSGLVLPADEARALEAALEAVMADVTARFGLDPRTELHGHELAQGKGDWAPLAKMLRARLGIYRSALEAIRDTTGVRAFQYGLDRQAHRARYKDPWPERQVLLGHLAQRVNNRCATDDSVLLIVDDAPAQESIREHVHNLKRGGTHSKFNPRPLAQILDTVYFAPSKRSRLLQASDLVSYIHFRERTATGPSADPRAVKATRELWAIVASDCTATFWKP